MSARQEAITLQVSAKECWEESQNCIRWIAFWERRGGDETAKWWRDQALYFQRAAAMDYAAARNYKESA